MRKLFLVVALILALVIPAVAQESLSIGDTLEKIPGMKQGIGYSFIEHDINYLTTIELMNWQGIALEGGYNSKDKIVAVISGDLVNLKELGVKVPILDLIDLRVGLYAGYGRIDIEEGMRDDSNEFDWGASLTLITVKF